MVVVVVFFCIVLLRTLFILILIDIRLPISCVNCKRYLQSGKNHKADLQLGIYYSPNRKMPVGILGRRETSNSNDAVSTYCLLLVIKGTYHIHEKWNLSHLETCSVKCKIEPCGK